LTNYEVGLGACGVTSTEDQKVVAISHILFDAVSTGNPNTNPLCGKMVYITGADGATYPAKIVDRCPGCDEGSLDLPLPYFNTITNYGDGRVKNMKWTME
jgi:expansin (peptidoglycan-binding protein)